MDLFKTRPKHRIKAVQDQDLEKYLKSIGIFSLIQSGKELCKFCGNIITLDTLEAIIPQEGKISLVCSNQKCINQI